MSRAWAYTLAAAVLLAGASARAASRRVPQQRIDSAVARAVGYLTRQIGEDGRCAGEFRPDDMRQGFGGKTALCLYALLGAGIDHRKDPVKRAMDWVLAAELKGTYAVSMRACALAAVKDDTLAEALAKDVRWLIEAANNDGAYTYASAGGKATQTYDNSNSQMAVLGVWSGAGRGVEVPARYWQKVERHWTGDQHLGAWGYHTRTPGANRKTYGSMTAAGLATLYICFDNLRRDQFVRCTGRPEDQPIAEGLTWLAENFTATDNPKLGANWLYYWLFCVERVGLASGMKYFGKHDWYAAGVESLLAAQNDDGSWSAGDRIPQTAFALLFLVHGRNPVLFNKLRYKGKWNARPRDLANLTRFLSNTFERPVGWQIIEADSPLADWHDAPILYLSGAGPIELTDEQIARMRSFVHQGGMILSEAACNSGTFTLDMQKIYKRLFPDYPLQRLGEDHPIYSLNFTPIDVGGISGVSNGVRMLAIHAPRELSLALQLGPGADRTRLFELLANLYFYATDKGVLRPRGAGAWPAESTVTPKHVLRIARVKYKGNYNPEPLAWQRLARLVADRHAIRLIVSEPMEIGKLDAEKHPVAAMTGTDAFTLSDAEAALLKQYLAEGGTLFVDAAGGSQAFAKSAEQHVLPLGDSPPRLIASTVLTGGPAPLKQVNYRRDFAMALGDAKHQSRLQAVLLKDRIAIVYSSEDLTAGLCGYPGYKLRAYTSETAVVLVTNLLCHIANIAPKP